MARRPTGYNSQVVYLECHEMWCLNVMVYQELFEDNHGFYNKIFKIIIVTKGAISNGKFHHEGIF